MWPGSLRIEETERGMEESVEALRELLTLDELTNRVGMSVRNVRFYTTRACPPPIRRGRSGYYTPDHVARLELVQELQSHGFTLSAIEKYVANIPATPPRGHRAAADDARAVAAREPDRDVPRRARQARRTPADRRRPGDLTALGVACKAPRPLPGRGLPALRRPRAARPRLPAEAALAASDVYAAHGGRSPRSCTRSSARRRGRSTRSPGPRRSGSGRSSNGSSRSRSRAWSRPTRAAMDETKRAGIADGRADRSAQAALGPPSGRSRRSGRGDAEPGVRVSVPAPPQLGRPLIHIAGTRRSCRREPESMKHLFPSRRWGAWVTTAIPSSMVNGVRPRSRMTGSASTGRTPQNSSRSTPTSRYADAARISSSGSGW